MSVWSLARTQFGGLASGVVVKPVSNVRDVTRRQSITRDVTASSGQHSARYCPTLVSAQNAGYGRLVDNRGCSRVPRRERIEVRCGNGPVPPVAAVDLAVFTPDA